MRCLNKQKVGRKKSISDTMLVLGSLNRWIKSSDGLLFPKQHYLLSISMSYVKRSSPLSTSASSLPFRKCKKKRKLLSTSQINRNTIFNTFKQIIHVSFSSKGMDSIHFPGKERSISIVINFSVSSQEKRNLNNINELLNNRNP